MHSIHRTIDDMMNISDGHNPFHYIQGRGIDPNTGDYVPFNSRAESAHTRNQLIGRLNTADDIISRNLLASEALEIMNANIDEDPEEINHFPTVIEALNNYPHLFKEDNIKHINDLIDNLKKENLEIEQYKDKNLRSYVKSEDKKGTDVDTIAKNLGVDKSIIEQILNPKSVKVSGAPDPSLEFIKKEDIKKQDAMKAYKQYIDSLGLKTSDSDEQVKNTSKYLKSVLEPDILIPSESERLNPITEFGKNDIFEDRMSGVENDKKIGKIDGVDSVIIKEKYSDLSAGKNKFIRIVINDLFPDLKKELDNGTDKKVFAFNTGYNVISKDKDIIWRGNTNHWVDGLWIIKWKDRDGNEREEKIAPEYKYYSSASKYKMKKNPTEQEYYEKLPYNYEKLLEEENSINRNIRLILMNEYKDANVNYEADKIAYALGKIEKKQLKESKNKLRKSAELINDPNKLQEYITRNAKTSKHGVNMSLSKTGVFHSEVEEDPSKKETEILQDMLKTIHKIPKINPKTGKIEAVVNRQGVETSWSGYDTSSIFKGAEIALIVGMQDGLIVGENLSKDIRDGKFDPKNPLKSTNISQGSYGEQAKSIAINPKNFKVLLKEK
jgi:hypothetical protein